MHGGGVGSCKSSLGMSMCPVLIHGANSYVHEAASRWRELFRAQIPYVGRLWGLCHAVLLQAASHCWNASYRGSHTVLPAKFAHRGREVQWRP
jgi:dienelactone hydrolase